MSYALLDDQFYDHPKVLDLLEHEDGLAAVGMWTLALGWAKRHTDPKSPDEAGHLPVSFPRRIGGNTELANLLVRVGLWRAVSDGWVIHEFAHWQQLEAWAERSAKARAAVKVRWDAKRKADAARNGGVHPGWKSQTNGTSSQQTPYDRITDVSTDVSTDVIPTSPHLTSPQEISPPEISTHPTKTESGVLFGVNGHDHATSKPKRERSLVRKTNAQFAEWYATYPLHKAPGAAETSYDRAIREGADPIVLLEAARRYREDPQVVRGYAKHPATWLNQKCWLDEEAPAPVVVDRRQQATNDRFAAAMRRAQAKEANL